MKQAAPKVSVVIPSYNRAHLLCRAIQSVRNQTYQNFELIVVDDGSTDRIRDSVQSFDDERIRYIRHEASRGAAAARNTGINACIGEYIAFLDDDDQWDPDKLEKQLKAIENADAIICASRSHGTKTKKNQEFKKHMVDTDILRKGNMFDPSGFMAKSHVLRDALFDEHLRLGEDWDQFIRIASRYTIVYIDEPLVVYDDGAHERVTNEAANMSLSELEKRMAVLYKHADFFGPYWFNYHMAKTLLSYIGRRDKKLRQVACAIRRCGVIPVLHVLVNKIARNLSLHGH